MKPSDVTTPPKLSEVLPMLTGRALLSPESFTQEDQSELERLHYLFLNSDIVGPARWKLTEAIFKAYDGGTNFGIDFRTLGDGWKAAMYRLGFDPKSNGWVQL